jgi:UDP-glucose 4-epimerase
MGTILITGARGAIGQRVVRFARARTHRVFGLGHGAWPDFSLQPIDHWINGEIDSANLSDLKRAAGVLDAIIHLAGGSVVGQSLQHPSEDFQRTVGSSQRLIDWMRTNAPEARLVVASSAAVYGDRHAGPICEESARMPMSPYATHKYLMEVLCEGYARDFGLPVALLRLFSVYGPGLRKQVIWDLARRCLNGEPAIELGGTGEETRDFLHIDDAAQMLLDACELATPYAPVFNICTGAATRMADLAAQVVATVIDPAASGGLRFSGDCRRGDPLHLVGNPEAATAAGLQAKIKLADGLVGTVDWIRRMSTDAGR